MIVDAHHHLWDLGRFPYRWLAKDSAPRPFGDHTGIKRGFLPDDYRRDTRGLGIVRTVHVEAAPNAPGPTDESDWLVELRKFSGMPDASIAHTDLLGPEVERDLDAICAVPDVRGVRAGIAWRADSPWKFSNRAGISRTQAFRAGAAEVARRGLILELILLPEQLAEMADLADLFPGMPIVANHLATLQPEISGLEQIWQAGIQAVAQRKNTFIKLSGLWSISRTWARDALEGPVRTVVDAFGPDRCMWGSNLPVEGLMCSASRQLDVLNDILAPYPADDRSAVFAQSAVRLYRFEEVK